MLRGPLIDFHRFSIDFHRFSYILLDFLDFHRFSLDFHRFSYILLDFLNEGALAGFYRARTPRVRWLVFIERGCAGWFLANQGALAGFPRHIENMEEFNRNMKESNGYSK